MGNILYGGPVVLDWPTERAPDYARIAEQLMPPQIGHILLAKIHDPEEHWELVDAAQCTPSSDNKDLGE